ncbi:uncharacterized protein EV420DRAFT_1762297 [Desarmillaria tabescens]|uniref:Uncharacterized protein n=1 Tax=Armillaria tabescens TaxID=1929756 RepID=A0AA39TJ89_ARMTA|nr:uncharacterized protein EV420DRAFT_1762297 [Desarmillaria tabescens]KAK0460962.1 hypothetical protein EV420DRAFT_1762297 [Desarmillaria tabescens]
MVVERDGYIPLLDLALRSIEKFRVPPVLQAMRLSSVFTEQSSPMRLATLVVICGAIGLQIECIIWIQRSILRLSTHNTQSDEQAINSWQIPALDPILMAFEDSVHYGIHGSVAKAEWDSLVPGDGLIYLEEQGSERPFMISMFHELRCLGIIRDGLLARWKDVDNPLPSEETPAVIRHCVNYLRQMIICRCDIAVESLMEMPSTGYPDLYLCKDWSAVYDEAVKNQQLHAMRTSNS